MRTVLIDGMSRYMPTREDIDGLRIGDTAPNCFRESRVTDIFARGTDISGRRYVCYYTEFGKGGTISASMLEDDICWYMRDKQNSEERRVIEERIMLV